MPIDASIYDRLIQPVKQPDSFADIVTASANMKNAQALAEDRRMLVQDKIRQAQEDGQVRQVMSDPNTDMPTKIQHLYTINPKVAGDVEKTYIANQKTQVDLTDLINNHAASNLALYDPKDQSSWGHVQAAQTALYKLVNLPVPAQYQGPPPTQEEVDKWRQTSLTVQQQNEAAKKHFEKTDVVGPDGKTVTIQGFDPATNKVVPVTDEQGHPVVSAKTLDVQDKAADNARQQANDAFTQSMRQKELAISAAHLALAKKAAASEQITPQDMQSVKRTTLAGNDYIDMGDFEGQKERSAARAAAQAANLPVVDAKTGSSLKAVDTAKQNMMAQWRQLSPYLAKDSSGRLISGPENMLGKVFQTHPELGSIGAWRTAAIQQVQALAEPGMGLRITQAEIQQAMDNDIPQLTDDAPTAANRLKTLFTMLTNKENDALVRNRSSLMPGATPAPAATTAKNPFRK